VGHIEEYNSALRRKEVAAALANAGRNADLPGVEGNQTGGRREKGKPPTSVAEKNAADGRNWDKALLQKPDGESEINNPYWQWPNQMKQAKLAKQKGDFAEALRLFELSASSADTERTHAEEGYRNQGKDPGSWPAMRRNRCFRQQRVTSLVNQIIELDTAIEAAANKVQGMLTGITDSKTSDTKMERIKRDVMQRLKKSIDYYVQKRTALTADVRTTTNKFERTDLFKDRSSFDDRINRRIDGIISLALSMNSHEEYEKFLYSGSSDGWNIPHIRRNLDYDHNLKTALQKDAAVTEIEKALSDSLARLDTEERSLKQRIESAKPEQTAALEKELERVRMIKMQRYDQEEDLRHQPEKKAQPVDMKAAQQIEDVIEEIAADARRDFASMLACYKELKTERTALARLQLRLEAAEAAAAAPKK